MLGSLDRFYSDDINKTLKTLVHINYLFFSSARLFTCFSGVSEGNGNISLTSFYDFVSNLYASIMSESLYHFKDTY